MTTPQYHDLGKDDEAVEVFRVRFSPEEIARMAPEVDTSDFVLFKKVSWYDAS